MQYLFVRIRWLASISLPLLISAPALGQVASIAGDQPLAEKVATPEPVIWNLTPAAAPIPALRYRLWPDRASLVPGNAMVPVNRAMVLMLEGTRREDLSKQFSENYDLWFSSPLEEMPKEEVRAYIAAFGNVLRELHRMTLMRESEYDLGLDNLRGVETVEFLLPEIQNARELGRLLTLEARLALAEGRFEDALRSMRTGIRLGGSVSGAGDLLIIKLVGIAITSQTIEHVETISAMPDAPNLYWALATIPESIYDVRPAIEFESQFVSRVFPHLADLPDEELDPAAWRIRLTQSLQDLQKLQSDPRGPERAVPTAQLFSGLAVVALAEKSRSELVAEGLDAEVVNRMSPSEAVVRATSRSIVRIQDEYSKWLYTPDSIRTGLSKRAEEITFGSRSMPGDLASAMAGLLLPAIRAADSAGLRTEQTIAKLVTAQALRDYAAANGELPASLDDLDNLPAWPDPLTGESFGYKRTSPSEAVLTATPPYSGDRNTEITLRLVK